MPLDHVGMECLKELVKNLKVLQQQRDDLDTRIDGVRALIQELVEPLGEPVDMLNRRIRWQPPSKMEKLDRAKLVQAGVTAEQILKGTVLVDKKGYLDIRTIREWPDRSPKEEAGKAEGVKEQAKD